MTNNLEIQHVLIVDDKKENLLGLESILKADGKAVDAAISGTEALTMCMKKDYDLFILDVQMPEMDGFELAGYLKGSDRTKKVPIIFLTAISQEDHHMMQGYEVGAVDYLFKPINSDLLILKVNAFLQLRARQKKLAVTNRIFEEKNRELSQFTYIVSHDLKAPLRAITNLLQWIKEDMDDVEPALELKFNKIINSTVHMDGLIAGFLDYAKAGTGKFETEQLDTKSLTEEALLNMALPGNFSTKVSKNMPVISSYKLLFTQIIENLVISAIKCNDRDEGTIELSYAGFINKKHHFEIFDNEADVPEYLTSMVFDVFEKAKTISDPNYIGIGLSLVKKLAAKMNADVWIDREPEKGIKFMFAVPEAGDLALSVDKEVMLAEGGADRKNKIRYKILIVDDREENLMVSKSILNNEQYLIDTAQSGEEALKKSIDSHYNLFILDAKMPEMDGYELARHLKGRSHTGNVPILFISANYYSDEFIVKGIEAGAIDYIFSPINGDLLRLKVVALLEFGQQYVELNYLNQALDERNEELSQFSYMVSHVLKAPLREIKKEVLGLMLEKENFDDQMNEFMELTLARTMHMDSLINGLLEYSNAGTEHLRKEAIDVSILIGEILESLEVPDHFTINISKKLPVFTSYQLLLQQIFSNLISNAIKYNTSKDAVINITYELDTKGKHVFCVDDNGPGIPRHLHFKVFDVFQKGEKNPDVDSTGVGLAIVKKLVTQLGGEVWIDPDVVEGTRFVFTVSD